MTKNRTRYKGLDVVNDDPRIECVEDEGHPSRGGDGLWLYPERGWTCDPLGAHLGHESTVKDLLRVYRGIVPCACAECAEVVAHREVVAAVVRP